MNRDFRRNFAKKFLSSLFISVYRWLKIVFKQSLKVFLIEKVLFQLGYIDILPNLSSQQTFRVWLDNLRCDGLI